MICINLQKTDKDYKLRGCKLLDLLVPLTDDGVYRDTDPRQVSRSARLHARYGAESRLNMMSFIEKNPTLTLFLSIAAGIILGKNSVIRDGAECFIIPFLFLMLLGLFVGVDLKGLGKSFRNTGFLGAVVFINFIWSPLLAWLLGWLFLSSSPSLWIAFIMLMVTPCTDWYLVFTALAKGNVPLSASVLPVNLILQIFLLPVYMFIFAGTTGVIPLAELGQSIVVLLLFPFAIARFVVWLLERALSSNKRKEAAYRFFSNVQTPLLSLAIVSMFASYGQSLLSNPRVVITLMVPILIFFVINFAASLKLGELLRFPFADRVSLTITGIAKNSPMTLGIAVMVFPEEPIIALAMIIEPLIELPVITLFSNVLKQINRGGMRPLPSMP